VALSLVVRLTAIGAPVELRYRFGFGVRPDLGRADDYDVGQLRGGWYVDWGARADPSQPAGLEYAQMVRMHQLTECWPQRTRDRDACPYVEPYTYTLTSPTSLGAVASIAQANPGSLWLVGNEMDRRDWDFPPGGQDEMLPELYAQAYHEIYETIKDADPAAQVAIGGVVQPTPLRLEYLDKVVAEYESRYGTRMPVDVWNIHNMILREVIYQYGADIPPGDDSYAGKTYTYEDADDIEIFKQQIVDFREWMKEKGEQNKPLIISEYSVLYGESQGFDYPRVTDYLYATFDYMTTAADPSLGYPLDGNRLVQRWAWYSLNDANFEGAITHHHLFTPTTKAITQLGIDYGAYGTGTGCPTGSELVERSFSLAVDLQRPNAPAPDPSWAVPVRLSLHPPGDPDTICHAWHVALDEGGEWAGNRVAYAGIYDVRLKHDHTLRNVLRDVEIGATNTLDMGTLLEGDANNDNRVRITDFGILRNAYFTNEGEPGFDPRADFDENGEIRIRDFSLLRLNYFEGGDVEVGTQVLAKGATAGTVDVSVEPPTATLEIGRTGDVTVTLHAGEQAIIGGEFDLRFDTGFLAVVDALPDQDGVQVEPVGPFSEAEVLKNEVDAVGGEGRVRYGVGTFGDPISGEIPLARIQFRGLTPTIGTGLHFDSADASDAGATSVIGEVTGATVIVTGDLQRHYLPLVVGGGLDGGGGE
jgi:hypothetical protein